MIDKFLNNGDKYFPFGRAPMLKVIDRYICQHIMVVSSDPLLHPALVALLLHGENGQAPFVTQVTVRF